MLGVCLFHQQALDWGLFKTCFKYCQPAGVRIPVAEEKNFATRCTQGGLNTASETKEVC